VIRVWQPILITEKEWKINIELGERDLFSKLILILF
jgi:hypothetical protein